MKRSTQMLLVYIELRRALGDEVPACEVLDIAERLTDLAHYRKVIDRCGTADLATPGCIPLDRAFDDGGWALLHDVYSSGLLGDDDAAYHSWRAGRHAANLMEHSI